MLIKMNIRYGGAEAIDICDGIGLVMANTAIETSIKLAEKDGSFPKFNSKCISDSMYYKNNTVPNTRKLLKKGLRNSQLLTIAPTGSLSSMLGVSGGIEPIYAYSYTRKTQSLHGHDEFYKIYTPIVKDYMNNHGIEDEKDLPDFFVSAGELDYKERIRMQAIWQTHIDASISSTVNVPNSFTVEDTMDLYLYAWHMGLKGVTIFRDGCARLGILTADKPEEGKTPDEKADCKIDIPGLARGEVIKVNDNCIGKKRTLHTGCGTLHCEAFFDPHTGDLRETYLSKGSTGGCNNFMVSLSRMISLSARGGIDIYAIVDQLKSSGTCPSYAVRRATKGDTSKGSSCPVAVGHALIEMYEETNKEITIGHKIVDGLSVNVVEEDGDCGETNKSNYPACPECGGELIFEGGCNTCTSCGYTKCE